MGCSCPGCRANTWRHDGQVRIAPSRPRRRARPVAARAGLAVVAGDDDGATPAFGARVGIAVTALALTVAVGFAGAKMVCAERAGIDAGRQYARTDRGASLLAAGLATNAGWLVADYWHFLSREGLWPCTPSRARPRQSAARCASRSRTAAGACHGSASRLGSRRARTSTSSRAPRTRARDSCSRCRRRS